MNAALNEEPLVKLDIGCGKNKREGFSGVDRRNYPGVDIVRDLMKPWLWGDNSVEEIHASHVIEHFNGKQRVHIFNEMYRVLRPEGKATVITPHWNSNRAYGDFTHQWPPVSEMLYYYLNKAWRDVNAPDNDIEWNPKGYTCNFEATWGHGLRADLLSRNTEYQVYALTNYKDAASDLYATLVAKK
jgi:Methyltransferase domain